MVGMVPTQLVAAVYAQSTQQPEAEASPAAASVEPEQPSGAEPSPNAPSPEPDKSFAPTPSPDPEPVKAPAPQSTPSPALTTVPPETKEAPPAASPVLGQDALNQVENLGPEIESERKLNAKVFTKADGTKAAKVYASPIHFKGADGKLRDIDNRIVADATGFKNAAGPAEIRFARQADSKQLLSVREGKNRVSFSLQGAGPAQAVTEN